MSRTFTIPDSADGEQHTAGFAFCVGALNRALPDERARDDGLELLEPLVGPLQLLLRKLPLRAHHDLQLLEAREPLAQLLLLAPLVARALHVRLGRHELDDHLRQQLVPHVAARAGRVEQLQQQRHGVRRVRQSRDGADDAEDERR